jgi:hypothetical protein
MDADQFAAGDTPMTRRLFFAYEGDQIELVAQERVAMPTFPSAPVEEDWTTRFSGFWYELQDAEGRTLYRRATESPLQATVEVPTGDPAQPFTRQQRDHPQGHFVLVVPETEAAESVALFGGPLAVMPSAPLDREALAAPAQEIARFRLT